MQANPTYKIDSIHNPKIKALLKLQTEQVKPSINEFVIDGENFCQLANNKNQLISLWITSEKYQKLNWSLKPVVKVYLINELILKKLSQVEHSSGIIGVCQKPKFKNRENHNLLILDDLQDPGNLGTLIRSAAAFNFLTIVASPNSVSFYNHKVLRSTQGLIFDLNLITRDLNSFLNEIKQKNYEIIGTFLHKNAKPFREEQQTAKSKALLIGNEGHGLKEQWLKLINSNFIIKMNPEVESLNAAIAGSIIMYQLNKH